MQPDWIDALLFLSLLALLIYVIAVNNITTLHKAYVAFHSMMMMWPLCHFLINLVPYVQFQWFFLNVAFVGLSFLGFGWLVFSLVLTKRIDRVKRPVLYLSSVPAILSSLVVTTNPWHWLFAQPHNGSWMVRVYGPLFWVFVFSCIFYLTVATTFMIRTMISLAESNIKKQVTLCLWGMICLFVLSLLDVLFNVILFPRFGVVPGLTSLGIIISAAFFVIAIQKHDLFRIVTVAQREVIDSMNTGMIVIDKDEVVLDFNKSAMNYFALEQGRAFDLKKPLTQSEIEDLNEEFLNDYNAHKTKSLRTEITFRKEKPWHVSIHVSPVLNGKKLLGRIVTLNDVTELRSLLEKINENNTMLQHQNKELLQVQRELYHTNEKLERLTITDDLTGCYNKRYLLQHLIHDIVIAQRYKIPFAIMLMDLDKFKQVNDKCGHLAGDDVLRNVVAAVQKNLRKADILARFGGEEFILYIPHTDREGAVYLAEKIRSVVQSLLIQTCNGELKVTISIGIVIVDEKTSYSRSTEKNALEELLSNADSALYEAKTKGRNCVVVADL